MSSITKYYPYIMVVVCSTWIRSLAINDVMNGPLITLMYISPVVWMTTLKRLNIIDILGVVTLSCMYICANMHAQSWRASTFLYTCMFFFYFLSFCHLMVNGFKIDKIFKTVKLLIYSHFAVIVLQQLCLMVGLEPFNYNLGEDFMLENELRINGLSPEPSNIARFVIIFGLVYLSILRNHFKISSLGGVWKYDKKMCLCFIWSMLTIGSTTAVIFIPLILIPFATRKQILYIILFALVSFSLLQSLHLNSVERAIRFIPAVLTLDIDKIFEADGSGSYRVISIISLFQHYDLLSMDGLFGYGIDYDKVLVAKYLPMLAEGTGGGGIFALMLNYGFLPFALFAIFIFKACYCKKDKLTFWIILFIISIQGINVQIFWCGIIFLYINKLIVEKYGNTKNNSLLLVRP